MPLTIHPRLISTATPRSETKGLRRQTTPATRIRTPTRNRTARSHPSMVWDTTAVAIRIAAEEDQVDAEEDGDHDQRDSRPEQGHET